MGWAVFLVIRCSIPCDGIYDYITVVMGSLHCSFVSKENNLLEHRPERHFLSALLHCSVTTTNAAGSLQQLMSCRKWARSCSVHGRVVMSGTPGAGSPLSLLASWCAIKCSALAGPHLAPPAHLRHFLKYWTVVTTRHQSLSAPDISMTMCHQLSLGITLSYLKYIWETLPECGPQCSRCLTVLTLSPASCGQSPLSFPASDWLCVTLCRLLLDNDDVKWVNSSWTWQGPLRCVTPITMVTIKQTLIQSTFRHFHKLTWQHEPGRI